LLAHFTINLRQRATTPVIREKTEHLNQKNQQPVTIRIDRLGDNSENERIIRNKKRTGETGKITLSNEYGIEKEKRFINSSLVFSCIDHRRDDGRFPVSANCVTFSNPDALSSSGTGVNPGIRI
jgi:hypothetical protein